MKSKRSLIPKSKAKTAYGLLSEIRALILAEPLRYDQRDTLTIIPRRELASHPTAPACGTIGCVAGWVGALKHSRPQRLAEFYNVLNFAHRTLGLEDCQRSELFGVFKAGADERGPEHAKAGATHIASFQKKYRAQLLAKKV